MLENNYSQWYDSFKKSKQKPKSPYRVIRIENDIGVPVSGLENERVEAYSSSQARVLFFDKHPRLQDYLEAGIQIEVELDAEMLRQRQQIEELEKQHQEETVQNAWWND